MGKCFVCQVHERDRLTDACHWEDCGKDWVKDNRIIQCKMRHTFATLGSFTTGKEFQMFQAGQQISPKINCFCAVSHVFCLQVKGTEAIFPREKESWCGINSLWEMEKDVRTRGQKRDYLMRLFLLIRTWETGNLKLGWCSILKIKSDLDLLYAWCAVLKLFEKKTYTVLYNIEQVSMQYCGKVYPLCSSDAR